ncbi:MAG: DUF5685 family protein [Candidatus Electrothrix sp. YB6]
MFGVLRHAGCVMAPEEQQEWTGHVCGLCLALKNQYGHFARLTTNYDAALLSALYDAQTTQLQNSRISYCPLRSSRRRRAKIITPDNPGVRYAAAMSLIMASSRIKDHIQDNETGLRYIRGPASGVAERWMRAARKGAAELGFAAERITQLLQHQTEVEARTGREFSVYAEPTEQAVGAAFEHTAVLTEQPGNRDGLRAAGRMFGRIMYLLDSYEDYGQDLAAHRFNALAASFPAAEWRPQAVRLFRQAYADLKKHVSRLDLSSPALIHALLLRKLKQKGCRNLHICTKSPAGCRPDAGQAGTAEESYSIFNSISSRLCWQDDYYVHENDRRRHRSSGPWCCDCGCDCCSCFRDSECCDCNGSDSTCFPDCSSCDCSCCDGCDCGGCDCGCS